MKYTIVQDQRFLANKYFSKSAFWNGHAIIASWRPTINIHQLMKLKTARRLIRYTKIKQGYINTNWKIIPVDE